MAKTSGLRRWLLIAVVIVSCPMLYCAFVPAPAMISFPVPIVDGHEELSEHFWKVFNEQDNAVLRRADCATAHRLPDLERQVAGLPLLSGPPPVAAAPPGAPMRRLIPPGQSGGENLLCRFEQAIEETPDSALLETLAAAAYNWRAQVRVVPASMKEDLHEGRHHARRGVQLGNPMAGGFQAAPTWLLGFITDDNEYKVDAHTQFVDDTLRFPSFHSFIEGASMAGMLNPEWVNPQFDYNWAMVSLMEQLETCMFGDAMRGKLELPEGLKLNNFLHNAIAFIAWSSGRGYCYNNSAVPFNFPGMFVVQGDIYLKKGQMEYARVAYENSLNSPNAEKWAFRDQVHIRLNDMEGMRAKFLRESGTMTVDEKPTAMVVQSSWYCASCHQGPVGQGAPHGEPSI